MLLEQSSTKRDLLNLAESLPRQFGEFLTYGKGKLNLRRQMSSILGNNARPIHEIDLADAFYDVVQTPGNVKTILGSNNAQ